MKKQIQVLFLDDEENILRSLQRLFINEPYAIAKISGIKMCQYYYNQYNCNFLSIMPTNLYGPGDNFDLEQSHVLPALIRKFHEAKLDNLESVTLWGTGIAKREFLYVNDMAEASLFVLHNIDAKYIYNDGISQINVGAGKDISIAELAKLVKKIVGYSGKISYDKSKPDGMLVKLLNVDRLSNIGWSYKTSLTDGIKKTYDWFLKTETNNIRK